MKKTLQDGQIECGHLSHVIFSTLNQERILNAHNTLNHETPRTRLRTALRGRGTAAGLDVLEERTQRAKRHPRLFHAASRWQVSAGRVQATRRQRQGVTPATGVAGTLPEHGQDSGRLGRFLGDFGKKIKN